MRFRDERDARGLWGVSEPRRTRLIKVLIKTLPVIRRFKGTGYTLVGCFDLLVATKRKGAVVLACLYSHMLDLYGLEQANAQKDLVPLVMRRSQALQVMAQRIGVPTLGRIPIRRFRKVVSSTRSLVDGF